MKTLSLALAGLLAFAFTSAADILVYKNAIQGTITGAGTRSTYTASGYTLIDPDTWQMSQIVVFPKSKRYRVVELFGFQFDIVDAPTKTYTVATQADAYEDTNAFWNVNIGSARGQDKTFVVNGTLYAVPKVFNWRGNSIFPSSTLESVHEQTSGTWTFNASWSQTCSVAGDDINAATTRIVNHLMGKGYTAEQ